MFYEITKRAENLVLHRNVVVFAIRRTAGAAHYGPSELVGDLKMRANLENDCGTIRDAVV